MLLIAASLALLVVHAGVKLLIQAKRETLGNLYRCAAWFFIISGFLTLLIAIICCIAMFFVHGAQMMMKMHKENKMMFDQDHMGMHHKGNMKMMKFHHGWNNEDCNENMNCCSKEMSKCCSYTDYCKTDSLKHVHKP
jgi:predicted membrane protein